MIILEGPDGGGKTILAKHLSEHLGLDIAPRVVSQQAEAMTDLRVWTDHNLNLGFQEVIFDRHRLLTDPIYRAVLGKHNPQLYDPRWLRAALAKFAEIDPLIIFCIPPLEVVALNLADDPDNEVVVNDIERIYYSYVSLYCQLDAFSELTNLYWYDYSNPFGVTEKDLVKWIQRELDS